MKWNEMKWNEMKWNEMKWKEWWNIQIEKDVVTVLADFWGGFTVFGTPQRRPPFHWFKYALASQSLFDKVPLFHVSEQPEFSDHCKLTVEIPNKTENTVVTSPFKWIPLKARFLWESDSSIYFNNALN